MLSFVQHQNMICLFRYESVWTEKVTFSFCYVHSWILERNGTAQVIVLQEVRIFTAEVIM